jgi:peptide/nickel transport system substrate-binding protein
MPGCKLRAGQFAVRGETMTGKWYLRGVRVYLLTLTLFLCISGCESGPPDADSGPAAGEQDAAQKPVSGGTVVIAFPAEPDVLNPLISISSYTGQVRSLLLDGVMEMGEDLVWRPKIAHSYTLAPDSLSVTYHLRPWVWSDGAPLTAHDLATTLALINSPDVASPLRGQFAVIARAVVMDSLTIRYELKRVVPDPIGRTVTTILPRHLVAELDPARVHTWPLNQKPLSSGPFALESWTHNHELVLVPNERYPGTRPRLSRVIFRIIPDESARVMALEAGDVDFMEEIPVQAALRLQGGDAVIVHQVSGRLYGYLSWNFRNPLFTDKRTRKALSLAIDRSRFVDGLLGGFADPAASPLPPALWAHNPSIASDPFDPARARQLLAAVGWRDSDGDGILDQNGKPFEFEVLTRHGDPVRENGVVIIRENLRAVGVAVKPRVLEHATTLDLIRRGDFDAYLGLFAVNLLVDPSPLIHSRATDRYNHGHYANSEVDSLLAAALSSPDRKVTRPIWYRLQEVLAEDQPMAFLYYPKTLIGVSQRLRGVRPHILSPFNNISEWWIDPADRKFATETDRR